MSSGKSYVQEHHVRLFSSDGKALYSADGYRLNAITLTDVTKVIEDVQSTLQTELREVMEFVTDNSDVVLESLRSQFGNSAYVDYLEVAIEVFKGFSQFRSYKDVLVMIIKLIYEGFCS